MSTTNSSGHTSSIAGRIARAGVNVVAEVARTAVNSATTSQEQKKQRQQQEQQQQRNQNQNPQQYPPATNYPTTAATGYPQTANQQPNHYPPQQQQQQQPHYTPQQQYPNASAPQRDLPPTYTQQPVQQPVVHQPMTQPVSNSYGGYPETTAVHVPPQQQQQQNPDKHTMGQKLGLLPGFLRGTFTNYTTGGGHTRSAPVQYTYYSNAHPPHNSNQATSSQSRVEQISRENPSRERDRLTPPTSQSGRRIVNQPIASTLGFLDGVGTCVDLAFNKRKSSRPAHHKREDDCCYMNLSDATSKSLKANLCCLCFFSGYVTLRILIACLIAPSLAVMCLLVAFVMVPPTIVYAYSEMVCKAKTLGPVIKIFVILFIPILALLSPVTVFVSALFIGMALPFNYCMADSIAMIVMVPGFLMTSGLAIRKKSYAYYNQEGIDYFDIRLWAPFTALLGVVIGLAFCVTSFTLIQLLLTPKIVFSLIYQMWSEPIRDPERSKRDTNSDDVCYQLCMCCWHSCLDLGLCFVILFRLIMTLFFFVGAILFIPIAVIYGLVRGVASGANGWYHPKNMFLSPWEATVQYYTSVLEYCNMD